jgi:hypothetical protein
MPAPATRTWKFFGDVFSDTSSLDVTITFNDSVIHDGAISTDYSCHDYQNKWDEIMLPDAKHRLLCQTELAYSTTGLIPLSIMVNSDGVLNYAWTTCNYTTCNYTSSSLLVIDASVVFGTSCGRQMDNKRNIRIGNDTIDIAPLGYSYHITKELEFCCDIFMDPKLSAWIPGVFAERLRESWRTKF